MVLSSLDDRGRQAARWGYLALLAVASGAALVAACRISGAAGEDEYRRERAGGSSENKSQSDYGAAGDSADCEPALPSQDGVKQQNPDAQERDDEEGGTDRKEETPQSEEEIVPVQVQAEAAVVSTQDDSELPDTQATSAALSGERLQHPSASVVHATAGSASGFSASSPWQASGTSSWANTGPWLASGANQRGRQNQAPMSTNEKRDLDMMFKQQDKQESRLQLVDHTRGKQTGRRNRRGKEAPILADELISVTAGTAQQPAADQADTSLQEELSAVVLAVPGTSVQKISNGHEKSKKAKRRKPRRGKAVDGKLTDKDSCSEKATMEEFDEINDDGQSFGGAEDEAATIELGEEVEEDAEQAAIVLSVVEPELEQTGLDALDDDEICPEVFDAAVKSAPQTFPEEPSELFVLTTPTTSSTAEGTPPAPSTRQGSEAGDDAAAVLAEAVAVVTNTAEVPVAIVDASFEGQPRVMDPVVRRRPQAWADLADTSDDEPIGADMCPILFSKGPLILSHNGALASGTPVSFDNSPDDHGESAEDLAVCPEVNKDLSAISVTASEWKSCNAHEDEWVTVETSSRRRARNNANRRGGPGIKH